MTPSERHRLVDDLLDGEISEADFIRLEAELAVDPAAREDYYQRLTLQVLLDAEAEEHATNARKIVPAGNKSSRSGRWTPNRFWALAASVLIVAGVVTAVALWPRPHGTDNLASADTAEERVRGFAVITGQVNTVWKDSAPLADGALVPAGTLRLSSGVVQVETFSGVTAVIEGDAEFAINSPMEMAVNRGKVRAFVPPPARGFRIISPGGEVVDLGTEFAMDVSASGAEVHVLNGQIEWTAQQRQKQVMSEGEAVRWSPAGDSTGLAADAAKFVGVAELSRRRDAARTERMAAWQQYVDALCQDPRTVAYYRMAADDAWSRLIRNDAAVAGADKASDGVIVATSRAVDRWGQGAGALDFSRAGSRLRLNVPGELRSLTMFCWVKINSLDRLYNSLLLTDGHGVGAPHWQITRDGRLFFSVKKYDTASQPQKRPDKHNFFSPPIWTPAQSGQWMMLAVTYDVDARNVTHYVDGRAIGSERIPDDYLVDAVSIGNASIGNWSEPVYRKDAEFAVRNLNGSIGEFALLSAALSPEQIAEIYEHGKP